MKNLAGLMKQAQQMQSKMAEMQEALTALEIEGSSGAGMVKVVMSGKHELRSVKIDPSLINPDDVEVLEDLIMAAVNDAKTKVETTTQERMQDVTGGLNLPAGMKLPF
ncbi:YbaB/EbfC family nucleoid-associated protein [Kiloniella laminariae]|uniref:Nucleoid-associated protein O4H49_12410 n=1 Tax=Kiloniella laminariae TaxID=454162 RepID=A0ABT4LKG9_9PROT|nr:YbaB/EbfC family nucleoid-associated protein [Kiloniella laminariae]MCZ4281585.1 YbaB/EbfC family nucleoid-associated protein [Kiloniella laminariae]